MCDADEGLLFLSGKRRVVRSTRWGFVLVFVGGLLFLRMVKANFMRVRFAGANHDYDYESQLHKQRRKSVRKVGRLSNEIGGPSRAVRQVGSKSNRVFEKEGGF